MWTSSGARKDRDAPLGLAVGAWLCFGQREYDWRCSSAPLGGAPWPSKLLHCANVSQLDHGKLVVDCCRRPARIRTRPATFDVCYSSRMQQSRRPSERVTLWTTRQRSRIGSGQARVSDHCDRLASVQRLAAAQAQAHVGHQSATKVFSSERTLVTTRLATVEF